MLAEYSNLKIELALGSYYEVFRLEGDSSRLHVTSGLDVNPYFVNLGAGFDLSPAYKNIVLSVGIDIVRTARFFNIVPKDPVPPYHGTFPPATRISADGLPDALTRGEPKEYSQPNLRQVEEIVKEVPKNIEKEISGKPKTNKKPSRKHKNEKAPQPSIDLK